MTTTLDDLTGAAIAAAEAWMAAVDRCATVADRATRGGATTDELTAAQLDAIDAEADADRKAGEAVEGIALLRRIGQPDGTDDAIAALQGARLPPRWYDRLAAIDADPLDDAAREAALLATWPPAQPIRARGADLPDWPVDQLPDWLADHVRSCADQLQTPVDLCAQFALGAVSAAAMGHAHVVLGNRWHEPLNLWLATALPSGGGKSPAEKAMTRPLRAWEARQRDLTITEANEAAIRKRIAERRAKALEAKAGNDGVSAGEVIDAWNAYNAIEVPEPFRRLADDATPEALVAILAKHGGRIAVMSTEAELLDTAAGAYSGSKIVNLGVYLKGYSGDPMQVDRKGGGNTAGTEIRIEEPLIAVGLAMQPTVVDFASKANDQLNGRGFLARFLFSYPESMVGRRDRRRVIAEGDDRVHAERYAAMLTSLADEWIKPGQDLHLTHDAAVRVTDEFQRQEHEQVDGGRLANVTEWMSKLQSATLRTAGLLHLCDGRTGSERIDLATVERALVIADYWIAHALAMAARVDDPAEADAYRILDTLDRKRWTAVTPRELWLTLRARYRTVEEMAPALQHLEACGYLRLRSGTWSDLGVRRVSVVLDVRPTPTTLRAVEAKANHRRRDNARNARNGTEVWFKKSSSSTSLTHTDPPRVTRVTRVIDQEPSEPPSVDNQPADITAGAALALWGDPDTEPEEAS